MCVATRLANVLTLLGAFVAVAMVMGLLAAGLALPAIGAAGQATNSSIKMFNDMPSDFAMNPLAQQSKILASDNSVIGTPFNENRIVVPLNKIAPVMQKAQIAIEDVRFYEHGGVDPKGLLRAISSNAFSGGTQGASTLTQQYVKVALQNQALASGNKTGAQMEVTQQGMQGYVRKLQQLKYAVTMEQKYSKNDILDGYLNLVYYGDQQYGVEAAALHYYGVHASQLNLQQAATLAGVVNAPGVTDPINYPDASKARRNVVLGKMRDNKMITQEEYAAAVASPLGTNPHTVSSSCANSKYPYFCYYVYDWLLQQPALGKTPKEREAKLKTGGLTIQTSFDPKLASMMDAKIKAKVPVGNSADVQSAGIMIQPGTGLVLASAQNTAFSTTSGKGKSSFDYTVGSAGNSGFAYGSTAKTFAVITALENGMTPDSSIDLPSMSRMGDGTQYYTFTHRDFPGECGLGRGEKWQVPNDFPVASGPMKIGKATAESVNVAFGRLVSQLGACKVHDTAVKFGLVNGQGQSIGKTPSDITLGTSDVTPLSLANAYATLAAQGKYCPPRPVKAIKDANNKDIALQGTGCKQIVSKDVANGTTKIMEQVLGSDPLATAHDAALAGGRPAAGKTGTVDGANQTWFVGYTPQLTTAIWVGHVNSRAKLKNIRLGGTYYNGYIFGGTLAAPIWKSVMDAALKGQPVQQFTEPGNSVTSADQVTVPSVYGQTVANATTILESAGFSVNVGPAQSSRMYAGLIMGSTPGSGSKAAKGSTITIYPSSGRVYVAPSRRVTRTSAPKTSSPSKTSSPAPSKTSASPSPTKTSAPSPTHTSAPVQSSPANPTHP